MIEYPLEEILLVAFLAVLADASTWEKIEAFGQHKSEWLRTFLPFQNGTPSHETFHRAFSLIGPKQLEEATAAFLMDHLDAIKASLGSVPEDDEDRSVCADGKEQHSTGHKYSTSQAVRDLRTLHVFDASSYLCLASRDVDCKINEIPAAQEILGTMDLRECVVSFDALHTQKDTVKVIRGQGGDYIGGLIEDQPILLEDARTVFRRKDAAASRSAGIFTMSRRSDRMIISRHGGITWHRLHWGRSPGRVGRPSLVRDA